MDTLTSALAPHQFTRVRREVRRRTLTVTRVELLTPGMQRIQFTSPDFADFGSDAPDDHIKLLLPDGEMRDYTPRAFNPAAGTLTIDFALHGTDLECGPATRWAMHAKPGDTLNIGGPRGSMLVQDDFDWYLLIGDETALPAIGRRVETLRPGVPVITIGLISTQADQQHFTTQAAWTPIWVGREPAPDADTKAILASLETLELPKGDGYIWIAAEARLAKALRAYLLDTRSHPRQWLKAAGYWQRGTAGAHEKIED